MSNPLASPAAPLVIVLGSVVVDHAWVVDDIPQRPTKSTARGYSMGVGGLAANAAAASPPMPPSPSPAPAAGSPSPPCWWTRWAKAPPSASAAPGQTPSRAMVQAMLARHAPL